MTREKVRVELIHCHALATPFPEKPEHVSEQVLDTVLRHLCESVPATAATEEECSSSAAVPPPLLDLGFEEAPVASPRRSLPAQKDKPLPRNPQERLRGLTPAQQRKVAATGEQSDRVVLERMYGKHVWEALLRNPKLTKPEVARMARMGTLPKPLLERIANHRMWLQSPQVRRALLSNHRLGAEQVLTVLRATPKHELKLMPKQLSYPMRVRDQAAKLLK